jgi:hypothetical protein
MIGLMFENEHGYSREEAEKLGYDWAVVCFFACEEPDLLRAMWGSQEPYYQALLKNQLSLEALKIILSAQLVYEERIGNVAVSTLLALASKNGA